MEVNLKDKIVVKIEQSTEVNINDNVEVKINDKVSGNDNTEVEINDNMEVNFDDNTEVEINDIMDLNMDDEIQVNLKDIPYYNRPRVLIVDSDISDMNSLRSMVDQFGYRVVSCSSAKLGLAVIGKPSKFEILMIAVDMPEMNGLAILESISKQLVKLPVVIMMDTEDSKDNIFKAGYLGTRDYVMKPVKEDLVRNMWKHVVRMRKDEAKKEKKRLATPPVNVIKLRIIWTRHLHAQFVNAVNEIGFEKATPKRILKVMERSGCENLNRRHIASHLKKYKADVLKEGQQSVSMAQEIESVRKEITDENTTHK